MDIVLLGLNQTHLVQSGLRSGRVRTSENVIRKPVLVNQNICVRLTDSAHNGVDYVKYMKLFQQIEHQIQWFSHLVTPQWLYYRATFQREYQRVGPQQLRRRSWHGPLADKPLLLPWTLEPPLHPLPQTQQLNPLKKPTGTRSKKNTQTQKTQKTSEQHPTITGPSHHPKARNWLKS